jgi:hypothetical protein
MFWTRKIPTVFDHGWTLWEQAAQFSAGLPDFSWHKIPKLETYTKLPQNIPNVNKICIPKDRKWTKCPLNIPTSSIAIPSKMYPNLEFWLENKPSGNPGSVSLFRGLFQKFPRL